MPTVDIRVPDIGDFKDVPIIEVHVKPGDRIKPDDPLVTLEAMKRDGTDFFCGLTFPVGDSPCSFIVGGWGGGVVGLSSLNGSDASENETTKYQEFESNRWYTIRVRVTKDKIEAWIDQKQMVDVETDGVRISIRPEVELSRPLGIACYSTTAALRDIRIQRLDSAKK